MKTALLILTCGCLLYGCRENETRTPFVKSVEITRPLPLAPEEIKSFSGVVQEAKEINLGFKTAGQIEEIYVKEGDYVRQGQPIARLDDADYKLGVEALQIQYDQMQDEVERLKQLLASKSVTGNEYEKAAAGLAQLGVQLQANRNKLEYTRLNAPVSGYIQSVDFEPAEMVDAGTPLVTLLDVARLEVTADIPAELYVRRNRIGGTGCRTPFAPDREMPMTLTSITPKADNNQLYKMRLAFENGPDARLTAGMNVEVAIRLTRAADSTAFTLPFHALFQEREESCVWVVERDTTVSRRTVTVGGTDSDGRIIVTSGLDGSERIVKAGVGALREHEKVRIIREPSPTNVGGVL